MSDVEKVEIAAKAYAEATGYYTQFHAGLDAPSANLIRTGIRAALSALGDQWTAALTDVAAERQRQIDKEGWAHEHDDGNHAGEMATAAASYALDAASHMTDQEWWGPEFKKQAVHLWPWDKEWWKPREPRRNLVRAAALIIAEIERIDRSALRRPEGGK